MSTNSKSTSSKKSSSIEQLSQAHRRTLFESTTIKGMGPDSSSEQENVDAFYTVLWPVLEKEGGWTLIKGSGSEEGITIFCPPDVTVSDISQVAKRIIDGNDNGNNDTSSKTNNNNPIPELAQQQGPWKCTACGVTNEEGTLRCESCFSWREVASTPDHKSSSKSSSSHKYYLKMRQVISHVLKKDTGAEGKAAEAFEKVITNARELFGGSSSSSSTSSANSDNEEDEEDETLMSPTTRMTRQRFSDIAWKENRTHYEKSASRVGKEYQVDVLPVVGSHVVPNEEVMYDQVWDLQRAQKSGKIDFIDHRVKSSSKEPAYDILHKRDYKLPGFFAEVSKLPPTDCSHWTAEERAKFRKLVFEKHEDMWQISELLGRPVRECTTYYLGKFKRSKDFRSLRRVMEKARDETASKYPGEILCDVCGKGGKLVYCESCDSHYHLHCHDPPLKEVPEGNDWKCSKCVKKDNEEENTSNGDDEVVEVDTSTNGDEGTAGEDGSSFDGKKSDSSVAKSQDDTTDNSAAEKMTANDDMSSSYNSSSPGGKDGKRPSNEDGKTEAERRVKKAKNSSASGNFEEESMTSFVSDEVGGDNTEMKPPPPQQR